MDEIVLHKEKRDFITPIKRTLYLLLICSGVYVFFVFFLFFQAGKEIEKTKDSLFNNAPDLIVVFTGDDGRIELSLEKAKAHNQTNIFITGVYGANSVESLIRPMKLSPHVNLDLLKIDYFARNTVENVISTLRFLRENNGFKNILVITSDYHIPRVKMIFEELLEEQSPLKVYYDGVSTDVSNWRNLKISFREVFKKFRTYIFLKLWISDTEYLSSRN